MRAPQHVPAPLPGRPVSQPPPHLLHGTVVVVVDGPQVPDDVSQCVPPEQTWHTMPPVPHWVSVCMSGARHEGTGVPGRHPLLEPGTQQQPLGHEAGSQTHCPSLHANPLPQGLPGVHGRVVATGAHTSVAAFGVTVRLPNWSLPVSAGRAAFGHFIL